MEHRIFLYLDNHTNDEMSNTNNEMSHMITIFPYSNAFVSCKDTEDRIKWITCLRQVLACPMLRCNATNIQLGAYLMTKLECVYREGGLLKKKPVTCIGRQVDSTSMWIMNEDVHILEDGSMLDPMADPMLDASTCQQKKQLFSFISFLFLLI